MLEKKRERYNLRQLSIQKIVIFDAFNKVKSVEVEQLALDDLDLSSSTYMKIDVEGYEYFVLQGAKDVKKQVFKVVIIETVNDDIENAFILAGFSKRYYDVNNRELVKIKPKNYFTKNTILSMLKLKRYFRNHGSPVMILYQHAVPAYRNNLFSYFKPEIIIASPDIKNGQQIGYLLTFGISKITITVSISRYMITAKV